MITKHENNIIMVRRTIPKKVNLSDGRRFVSRYRKATRNKLPGNIKIKKN